MHGGILFFEAMEHYIESLKDARSLTCQTHELFSRKCPFGLQVFTYTSLERQYKAFCTRCSLFNKQSGNPYKRPLQ